MNEQEHLEKRLREQQFAPPPAAWRAEILAAVRSAATQPAPATPVESSWSSSFQHALASLLWPHPRAWAALAGVWAIILALQFSASDHSAVAVTKKFTPPSTELKLALRQQEKLFAELIGATDLPAAEPARRLPSGPRSARTDDFVFA